MSVAPRPMRRLEWSAILPMICGEKVSPKKWMQKRFTETAVARTGAETELTMAVLSGPVLRKRKNSAANSAGTAQPAGAEEKQNAEWQRESYAPEAEQVEGAVIGAEPALCDPAANGRAEDAVENRAGSGELAGFGDGEADGVVEKFGYPVGDAAHGKGQHGQAEGCGKESGIAEESGEGGAIGCGFDVILLRRAPAPCRRIRRGPRRLVREWRR